MLPLHNPEVLTAELCLYCAFKETEAQWFEVVSQGHETTHSFSLIDSGYSSSGLPVSSENHKFVLSTWHQDLDSSARNYCILCMLMVHSPSSL